MKYQPGFTDFFMSPVTGRIIMPMMPDLSRNYVWIGDRNDRPIASPVIIDLRLEIIDLRNRLSRTRFILQAPSDNFDSSQALNELVPGILKHNQGIVSIAEPWIDYVPPILPEKNIWIGNSDNAPEPYPRIFLENLPSMANSNPLQLLGAYNLYQGDPNPLNLGIPIVVKTLNITNMADLTEGYLWIGTNSLNPLNFGPNRPVEIKILPLDNMANLPYKKIWRGDPTDRPIPVDDLTDLESRVTITEEDITEINDEITTINEQITEINTSLGDILTDISSIFDSIATITSNISSILESIATINTQITSILDSIATINAQITSILDAITSINAQITSILDAITTINTHLGDIDVTLGDLQAQIDSNVASGLDHLADLQLQIDNAIASGNDHLATINITLSYLQSEIDTINSSITTINTTLTDLQTQIDTINSTLTTIEGDITSINSTITTIQGDITNITDVLIPAVYTYIDDAISNVTNNFVAGGVINMNNNRITNLPCDPVEDNDAISFCFLWHITHDEVTVSWS